jgi:hypothetical protein
MKPMSPLPPSMRSATHPTHHVWAMPAVMQGIPTAQLSIAA